MRSWLKDRVGEKVKLKGRIDEIVILPSGMMKYCLKNVYTMNDVFVTDHLWIKTRTSGLHLGDLVNVTGIAAKYDSRNQFVWTVSNNNPIKEDYCLRPLIKISIAEKNGSNAPLSK